MKLCIPILLLSLAFPAQGQALQEDSRANAWVDSVLNQISTEEKIWQLFMVAAYSNQTKEQEDALEAQIRRNGL